VGKDVRKVLSSGEYKALKEFRDHPDSIGKKPLKFAPQLERKGYLKLIPPYMGFISSLDGIAPIVMVSRDEDDISSDPRPVYRITESGREALNSNRSGYWFNVWTLIVGIIATVATVAGVIVTVILR
jgi:hypothetical protein